MLIERFVRWFDYEREVHGKVVASLKASTADHPDIRKAIELLGHIAAARQVWLHRLGAGPAPSIALFPTNVALAEVEEALASTHQHWSNYLASLGDADLDRSFEYRTTEGQGYRSQIEDVLVQLYGHSHYHRGQIARLVRSAGGEPAITDFTFWTRTAQK